MIPMTSECVQCQIRRNLDKALKLGTEEQAYEFTRRLMALMLEIPVGKDSNLLVPGIARLFHEMYGLDLDRFKKEREESNAFALARMEECRQKIQASENPVYAALQYAVMGNYLDFSALYNSVSYEKLDEMLGRASALPLAGETYDRFIDDVARAKTFLYVTDNAGEIGFDRLLAEQLKKAYPDLQITFCVRGAIAGNDATRADAEAVGLPFPVMDNGTCYASMPLDRIGEEAKKALETSDVILCKGMANTESMYGAGCRAYFAFLVKCDRIRTYFQKPMMTPMLVRDPNWK